MPTYRYELQQECGDLFVGQIAAQSAASAAAAIQTTRWSYCTTGSIYKQRMRNACWVKKIWTVLNTGNGPKKRDILDFTTQLAVMVRAGISLRVSIDGISKHVENDRFKEILTFD